MTVNGSWLLTDVTVLALCEGRRVGGRSTCAANSTSYCKAGAIVKATMARATHTVTRLAVSVSSSTVNDASVEVVELLVLVVFVLLEVVLVVELTVLVVSVLLEVLVVELAVLEVVLVVELAVLVVLVLLKVVEEELVVVVVVVV